MGKIIKYSVAAGLVMAAFALVNELPTYAEPCVSVEESICETPVAMGEASTPEVLDDELDTTVDDKKELSVADNKLEVTDEKVGTETNETATINNDEPTIESAAIVRTQFLVKFVEAGESFTVTDELADSYEVSSGMPMGPVMMVTSTEPSELKSSLMDAPLDVTVTQGEGGVFTITANTAGSYSVFLKSGELYTTTIMMNVVEFTQTDDPTLSALIDNFKAATKTIEDAMNSGDYDAMQAAWQSYMESMQADAKMLYGYDEYEQMMAMMRVMSMLIYGEDLVVEQYVYEYTDEDYDYIYEYDEEYAAILDEMKGMLADAGYTENVKVYDFDLAVYNLNDEPDEYGERAPIAWLNELPEERVVVIEAEGPAEGYERRYVVARAHFDGWATDEDGNYLTDDDGNWIPLYSYALLDNLEFDPSTGLLSVWSDRFSVFAITYEDVLVPKTPETGAFTSEAGANSSSILSVVSMAAMLVAMAGVLKFAKRK